MIVYTDTELNKFEPDLFGKLVRIRWNKRTVDIPNRFNDGYMQQIAYDEATIQQGDSRSKIIETIIASQYTTGGELAVINNKDIDPDSYAEYQAFRQTAKDLADEYLATL